MRPRLIIFFVFILLLAENTFAFRVSGKLADNRGPLAYVSVYERGTTYGVVSNIKGIYVMELSAGQHILVFQSMGYRTEERTINVVGNTVLDIQMVAITELLETVVIDKDREDPAYAVIREAIKRRKTVNSGLTSFKSQMYLKASLEVEDLAHPDTTTPDLNTKRRVNLIESVSDVYFLKPNLFKEVKQAFRNLAETKSQTVSVSVGVDLGEGDQSIEITNPYLFFTKINDGNFDFNRNLIFLPVLSEAPYVSPIADNAIRAYSFKLIESFFQDDQLIYKIKVSPRTKGRQLVEGTIYVNDKSFTLNALDLNFRSTSLRFFSHFRLIQNYVEIDSAVLIKRQEFYYEAPMPAGKTAFGNTVVQLSEYETNLVLKRKFMLTGSLIYDQDSYDKKEDYWSGIRPITLKSIEQKFIHTQDSIAIYQSSVEYLDDQDSIRNNLTIWNFLLTGIQHNDHRKGLTMYGYPLIQQIRINSVDGYRHTLGGFITKEWKNGRELESRATIDYGVLNKNIRGEVHLRYMYNPLKFTRLRLKYGNKYTMINTHESIQSTFSPSNYSDNVSYGIGFENEWFNGFLIKTYLDYNQFKPYDGKTLEYLWKNFPRFQDPQDFDPFEELVLSVKSRITFAQQYEIRPGKKLIIGSKYPIVHVNYIKGIKPWLMSDVNYDFIEVLAKQHIRLAKLGISELSVEAGRFLNNREVRLSGLKYFRGSDKYYFSNPLRTFQQIGPISLRTSKAYVQGHYIHHFNGAVLGSMGLFNRLSLQLACGTGVLYLEETGLKHLEVFAGLERPFRLWGQIFRFDVHYVTSTSSQFGFTHGVKFGIDFYNGYSHRWQY